MSPISCALQATRETSLSSAEVSTKNITCEVPQEPSESYPSEDNFVHPWSIFISNVDDSLSSLVKALLDKFRETSSTPPPSPTAIVSVCRGSNPVTRQHQLNMAFGDVLQEFFFPCSQQRENIYQSAFHGIDMFPGVFSE